MNLSERETRVVQMNSFRNPAVRDDIQSELDMMSASSDVESELSRLKGEITAGAPKQLEGSRDDANGSNQAPQQAQAPQAQAQAASIPASDRPAEPQDGEG